MVIGYYMMILIGGIVASGLVSYFLDGVQISYAYAMTRGYYGVVGFSQLATFGCRYG